jgi:competence protein ComEC
MASLALAAFLFARRHDPLHGLVIAFVGLLAVDPFLLWSLGFQLSFAAAAGILLLTPLLLVRLHRAPRPLAEALAVGVGAQVAVFPLLAFHFGKVSLLGIPANLAAFPLVAPITILGFAGGLFGVVSDPIGSIFLEIAGPFVVLLRKVAHFFAAIPGASIEVDDLGPQQLAAIYLLLAGAAMFIGGRRGFARYPVTIALVVWAASALVPAAGSAAPTGLRTTFFDVGQGDAALVESPGGARVLIDGGPDPGVSSDLKRLGISRIDLVVFSHAHSDHIDGLAAVLDDFTVRKTIEPGIPDRRIAEILGGRRDEVAGEGDRFAIGDLIVDVLGPDVTLRSVAVDESQEHLAEGSALNNASLVLRTSWASQCALFTGDLEEIGQELLVEHHREAVKCSVLKAPHHGSARIVQPFVEAIDPKFVVISVGSNDYGHPTKKALSMFERAGARVLRTDRLEDIVLELTEDGRATIR